MPRFDSDKIKKGSPLSYQNRLLKDTLININSSTYSLC